MGTEIMKIDDLRSLGKILAQSGFFKDATDEAKAIVKVLAGQELGVGAIASMTGINIIQGKPAIGAVLMASIVKRSEKYDYKIRKNTDEVVEIEFFQSGQSLGMSTFTAEDARRAGTQNMQKFPRNMLFARAMSNGVKWFCPDVFIGPVYTPEELGAPVNEDGDIIEGEIVKPEAGHVLDGDKPEYQTRKPEAVVADGRPWSPDNLKAALLKNADIYHRRGDSWTAEPAARLRGAMVGALNNVLGGDAGRHEFLKFVFGHDSSAVLTHGQVTVIMDWLNSKAGVAIVTQEAQAVVALTSRQMAMGPDADLDAFDGNAE